MKMSLDGDYITYRIEPITVFADTSEMDTLKKILNETAYQYYKELSKPQKLCLAEEVIQRMINTIGDKI